MGKKYNLGDMNAIENMHSHDIIDIKLIRNILLLVYICITIINMADLKQAQRKNIIKNIFNGDFRKNRNGGQDWRVLITDKQTRKILTNLFTCDEIFAHNIIRIEDLEDSKRNPVGCFSIYFLSSKGEPEDVFLKLVKDFKGDYNAQDYSYKALLKKAMTCLKNNRNGFLCNLQFNDPDDEEVEEVLMTEFSKYKKNLGGHVFFTGPEINFEICEQFQQSNAANFLKHQVNFYISPIYHC